MWRAAFDRFGISYDRFIRTTDPDHVRASIEMVTRAQAAGDIYKGTYAGWYCPGDNEFKTDAQLVDGHCPDHPTLELQWLEEENYFFALSRYQGALEELYATNPSFCEPEHFRNEVLGWLKEGLRDFSVSRAGSSWGIPFPGDPEHRIYVWFDALTNYLTGAGFPDDPAMFERFWPADLHVIGKNITRFHCLYWPAMLMSAGLPLPAQVFAHGFMLLRGEKMSKTRGNVLDPDIALSSCSASTACATWCCARSHSTATATSRLDGLIRRYNADLANDLGNLVNRTVSMANRYLGGRLPDMSGTDARGRGRCRAALGRCGRRPGLPGGDGAQAPGRGARRPDEPGSCRKWLRRVAGAVVVEQGGRDRAGGQGAGGDGRGVPDPRSPGRALHAWIGSRHARAAGRACALRRTRGRRPGLRAAHLLGSRWRRLDGGRRAAPLPADRAARPRTQP